MASRTVAAHAGGLTDAAVAGAAERLRQAMEDGRPCPPVRDLIGSTDIGAAYAVQDVLNRARRAAGAAVVGRKIGLTSEVVQRQLGVDQPDFGVLFADMEVVDGGVAPMGRLLQPKVEAEIAFGLTADLADGDLDDAQVRAAVAWAAPALEIVDSRIAGWDISFADTVADNASSGLFVLGAPRVHLASIDPVTVEMAMTLNGVEVSIGRGSASLGDPITALTWLARTAREFGDPLRAGQVVLSGALGPMVPVGPGDGVTARITTLGSVSVTFSKESA
jgi:2-keto-4-pentenoate hydratase